jgi:hypothetical protein
LPSIGVKHPDRGSGGFKEIGWRFKMASPKNQNSNISKHSDIRVKSRNAKVNRVRISPSVNSLLNTGGRLFDLAGTLAALFTIIDMCLVWYGAFYSGLITSKNYGSLVVGDFLFVLQFELMLIAPLALLWILAKFRGWI